MTLLRTLASRTKHAFLALLRHSFSLNFERSLQPVAESYYGFGRTLTHVFSSIGLIDKTHPWLRSSVRPRPLEVLAYVCARAKWNKPLSMPTVMAGSITLMLVCGTLAAGGFLTTTLLGAGQAYASMFTPSSPGTDLALKYMSNSFGIQVPGVPLATIDVVVGGFQKMMALYSMAMLVLAGFILLYILTTLIANTAHEGRFGGQGFNQVWAPIRLIVAMGLLVPLPMSGGYNGYNSGQYIVMRIAGWGSGLATNLWVPFATALANRGDVIATPNVPAAAGAVMGVLRNEFCMNRYNRILSDLGLPDPSITTKTITTGGVTNIFYSTAQDTQSNYCGMTTYSKALNTGTMATNISNGYETAYGNMVAAVKTFANNLNDAGMINIYTALPSAGQETAVKNYITQQFVTIVDNYQKDLAAVIKSTATDQAAAANLAMTTAVTQSGWAGAGMWFNTIARLNSEVMAASRGIPSTQTPKLMTATSAAANAGLNVEQGLADKVRSGLEALNQYLQNLPANYAAAGVAADAGAANVSGVFTESVTNGLTAADSSLLGDLGDKASGMFGFVLSRLMSTWVGGPFGEIGTGADTNISQLNPLAQLAAVGNWLMNLAMASAALAVIPLMPTGLTIILIGLATMTFSSGVLLFYVTPLVPFIRLMFGTIGWLLNILEAIIAIPLIAVAHLSTGGSGITGEMARTAYFMIFSIFLRPALLIVGMITALMMFTVAIGILNDLYKSAVVGFMGTAATGGGLSVIIYTMMYCVLAYGLCNLCFKLIELIPNQAMTWIGQNAAREITQDESAIKAMSDHTARNFMVIGGNLSSARGRLLSRAGK